MAHRGSFFHTQNQNSSNTMLPHQIEPGRRWGRKGKNYVVWEIEWGVGRREPVES